jgi:hypothetical protein
MAIDFNGSSHYLSCGSGASIDNLKPMSLLWWINRDSIPSYDSYPTVFCKHDGSSLGWAVFMRYDRTGGGWSGRNTVNLELWVQNGGSVGAWAADNYTTNFTGVWMHFAITYGHNLTTDDPQFYKNGVAITTTECSTPTSIPDDSSQSLLLAAWNALGRYIDGKLDDVRMINRIVGANEIAAVANGYRGPLGGEVAWWTMSEAAGVANWNGTALSGSNTLKDMGGNGNTATPVNSPTSYCSACARLPTWWANPIRGEDPCGNRLLIPNRRPDQFKSFYRRRDPNAWY